MKIAIVLAIVLLSAFTAVRLVTAFVRDQRSARYRAERQLVATEIERWASPQASRSSWDALLEGPFPDPDFERFRSACSRCEVSIRHAIRKSGAVRRLGQVFANLLPNSEPSNRR
jgi:hypothetical protein